MSLKNIKNIIVKTVATAMSISMVFGNISICGQGLNQVIAENLSAPEIEIELQNKQYVQYKEGENAGVALQSTLSIYPKQTADTYLPTENVEIAANLPKLNGHFPEEAYVVEARTKSTTGEEVNTNINQSYNVDSGLLSISYENMQNQEGKFNEGTKDEFEIIYNYSAEAYTGNEQEVSLNYNVNVKANFSTENGSITSSQTKAIELKEKENKGELTNFQITELKEKVYKGYLYSNVENKTTYNTDYKTVSTLSILNKENINKDIELEIKESEFELKDKETKVAANGNVIYKATGINKNEFDKILGQEGSIEIRQGEELIATVKYVEVENSKKLAIVYSEENIVILEDNQTSAIIEYAKEITNLQIKTSKPITEGLLHFENQATIKASNNYGCNVEDIRSVRTGLTACEKTHYTNILLTEPETKITATSSNKSFSTLQTSKTTLTIKLDDTNSSTKLFNNPTITVKLPEGLTNAKLSSPEILNGNGLKIKSATGKDNIITIQLEGKQTEYDLKNVTGGTSIVMEIENINFKDTMPTHEDKIEVTCAQGKETRIANCNVNIVSKAGLFSMSKLSNYDSKNSVTTVMDKNVKTVNIESNAKAKEAVNTVNLVNNYDQDLTNVQIIGRAGYADDNVESTFNTEITKEIEVSNSKVKVYYSSNAGATYNDNSWQEELTNETKACKIVLENNSLAKASVLEIKENVRIPENLGVNETSYLNWEVTYNYNGREIKDSLNIGMETPKDELQLQASEAIQNIATESGENIPVSLSVTPSITQDVVHSGQTVVYKIRVTNNSNQDLSNLELKDNIPMNGIYTYKEEKEGGLINYYETVEDSLIKLKTWNISSLKANKTKEFEIMLKMAKIENEEEVVNKVTLSYNNKEVTAVENKLTLKPAVIVANLATSSERTINQVYGRNSIVEYCINISNVSGEKLENAQVQYTIPQYINYIEGGIASYDEFEGYIIDKNQMGTLAEDNIFTYAITKLEAGETKTIVVRGTVQQLESPYEANIEGIAKVIVNEDTYESNLNTIKTIQSAFESKLSSNVKEGTTLKTGDNVTYTITVKNVGKADGAVTVKDVLPDELEVQEVTYSKNGEEPVKIKTPSMETEIWENLEQEETLTINIKAIVQNIIVEKDTTLTVKNIATVNGTSTNEISFNVNLKGVEEDNPSIPEDNPTDPDNREPAEGDNVPTTPEGNDPTNPEGNDPTDPEKKLYTISGVAWIDQNKDGKRNENEPLQDSVIVSLLNKETGSFALNQDGSKITATTDSNGAYSFTNIPEGTYQVLFEYDTNTYTVTTYQKEGIEENLNSDVMASTVTINGEEKLSAITNEIELKANAENIDIGLITNAVFDLKLDKQIVKTEVISKQGTETNTFKGENTAKVDLVAKYMAGSNVIVTYKFVITNNGDVTGYVNSLVDTLPSGLEFSSELNKDWYKGSDGKLYTTSLSNIGIKPGETSEVELVLTKTMTEENAEVIPNNAKLEKISNLENIAETDKALENNESSATLVISIKTGSVIMYTGITIACLAIIAIGVYIIKKKVLDVEI